MLNELERRLNNTHILTIHVSPDELDFYYQAGWGNTSAQYCLFKKISSLEEASQNRSKPYLSISSLFHKRLSSALKVTNINRDKSILDQQKQSGWCWVYPSLIIHEYDPSVNLEIDDWVIIEGKTMRLIKSTITDDSDVKILNYLKAQPLTYFLDNDDTALFEGTQLSRSTCGIPITKSAAGIVYIPQELLLDSYSRLAGASRRLIERLSQLRTVFSHFFLKSEPQARNITVEFFSKDPKSYNKIKVVTLNPKVLNSKDLKEICRACGVHIDQSMLHPSPTVENTIPVKKVLEVLTVYNSDNEHDVPWLLKLLLSNREAEFLLSADNNQPQQIMVSMEKEQDRFVGNAYTYWFHPSYDIINPRIIENVLDMPITATKNSDLNTTWRKLVEFMVCTQVVEAHRNRVPGTGKLARGIIRHTYGTSLVASFNVHQRSSRLFFPMAGNGGTSRTRNDVNTLKRSDLNTVECIIMSDDSDCDLDISP